MVVRTLLVTVAYIHGEMRDERNGKKEIGYSNYESLKIKTHDKKGNKCLVRPHKLCNKKFLMGFYFGNGIRQISMKLLQLSNKCKHLYLYSQNILEKLCFFFLPQIKHP